MNSFRSAFFRFQERRSAHWGLLFGLFLLGGPVIWSQAESPAASEEDSLELTALEVTADRDFQTANALEVGTSVIDVTSLKRRTESSLGEALAWESGVTSTFYGAGASRPVLRGIGGQRVRMLDGGLSTGDLSASSPDHAVAMEPLLLRTVTIHRGASGLFHGGGAIGGAVDADPDHLATGTMAEGTEGEWGALYESANDGLTSYLKSGYRTGNWATRVNFLVRETDDYRIPGRARTPEYDINNRLRLPPAVQGQVGPNPDGTVPNTGMRTRVAALGTGWHEGERAIQVGFQHFFSRYGVPLDGHTHGNPYGVGGVTGPTPEDGVIIELTQNRGYGAVEGTAPMLGLDHWRLTGAATHFRQDEREGAFLSNAFGLRSGDLHLEGTVEGSAGTLFLGTSWSREAFENRNISYLAGRADEDFLRSIREVGAAQALVERELGSATTVRFGGRSEWQTVRRDDAITLRRSGDAQSGVLEVEQALGGDWSTTLSVGRMTRLPNADELFLEIPHGATGIYNLPDPDLRPERSRDVEWRIDRRNERLRLGGSVFYRDFSNYIFLENQGFEVDGLTAHRVVQRAARFVGGEVEAEALLWHEGENSLSFMVFSDYVRATDQERDESLPRIPAWRIGSRLEAAVGAWSGGVHVLHVLKQDRVPQAVFGTLSYQSASPEYTLVTVHLERLIRWDQTELVLGLQVSNLLDVEARQHTSFLKDVAPLPGRSLQLQATWAF